MDAPPSDFKILRAIYERHQGDYVSALARAQRQTDMYVPVAMHDVAASLGISADALHGRLYFHLDPKYAPPPEPGQSARKPLYSPVVGDHTHCVNFPMLEAVLAGLWSDWRRQAFAVVASVFSLGIAVASLVVALHH